MGTSINASEATHTGISGLAYRLRADGISTNIGGVTDHLWAFVSERYADEFEAYVREMVDIGVSG